MAGVLQVEEVVNVVKKDDSRGRQGCRGQVPSQARPEQASVSITCLPALSHATLNANKAHLREMVTCRPCSSVCPAAVQSRMVSWSGYPQPSSLHPG